MCLKLERWQGPPVINKVKQYETILSFLRSVCLFSHVNKKFVYSEGEDSVNEDLFSSD